MAKVPVFMCMESYPWALISIQLRDKKSLGSLHFSLISWLFTILFSIGSVVSKASVYLINQN